MRRAVINYPTKVFRMIAGAFWRTPDTRSAKLSAPAILVVVWTIHLSPRMGSTLNNAPTFISRIFNSCSDFLFRMRH
jgi:hypothetical protein